ncbi:MAG: sulfite exporter TauE/SafE family protein [Bryobacteraceae bacterium]|nr:sulfite exporter TauE/SafE family protein [Bryobacteraceae bacterium]
MTTYTEALILGFGSGPVCLASCGPVLWPWLAAEGQDWRGDAGLLARFLSGRLAGYLAFAVAAWAVGLAVPGDAALRALVYGVANLALAVFLACAVLWPRRACRASGEPAGPLHQIAPAGGARSLHAPAAVTLGFLTGLNLCPPFVAAGIRAAEAHSLAAALLFFVLFFAGTAVWFAPSVAIGRLRRYPAVPVVARITLAVLAFYYLYLGLVSCAAYGHLRTAALAAYPSWRILNG